MKVPYNKFDLANHLQPDVLSFWHRLTYLLVMLQTTSVFTKNSAKSCSRNTEMQICTRDYACSLPWDEALQEPRDPVFPLYPMQPLLHLAVCLDHFKGLCHYINKHLYTQYRWELPKWWTGKFPVCLKSLPVAITSWGLNSKMDEITLSNKKEADVNTAQ